MSHDDHRPASRLPGERKTRRACRFLSVAAPHLGTSPTPRTPAEITTTRNGVHVTAARTRVCGARHVYRCVILGTGGFVHHCVCVCVCVCVCSVPACPFHAGLQARVQTRLRVGVPRVRRPREQHGPPPRGQKASPKPSALRLLRELQN
uniref:Uncharacterized protein n=1 Tax=Rousettus aegyptiacus TaxID=9407 RepID=A0A7J8CIN9_ROUAE|nr:hypothetical protein HJG63_009176 [Rousettus aegyptiacus]